MNICHWKPKKEFVSPEDYFAGYHPFFGHTLLPEAGSFFESAQPWHPAIDVTEEKDTYSIKVDLPGVQKENIELSAEGTVLTIKGERQAEEKVKTKNVHRLERSYGQFVRRLDLRENIDLKNIKAKYNAGVLEISVKKNTHTGVKKIQIDD